MVVIIFNRTRSIYIVIATKYNDNIIIVDNRMKTYDSHLYIAMQACGILLYSEKDYYHFTINN